MASYRVGNGAEWANGRSNLLCINEELDSGSMERSLAGGLLTAVGLLPAD